MDKKEYMLFQVGAWWESDLTRRFYCDHVGVKPVTFSYLARKSKNQQEDLGGFVEIERSMATSGNTYEITYPNVVVVRMGPMI